MEEERAVNENSVNWSSIVIYALYLIGIIGHVNTGHDPVMLYALSSIVGGVAGYRGSRYYKLYKIKHMLAFSAMVGDIPSREIRELNPWAWPNLADVAVHVVIGIYFIGLGLWPIAIIALVPCFFMIRLYNGLNAMFHNPEIQQIAHGELKAREDDDKRNVILNDEINKRMPEVLEAVKEKWREAGLMEEEDERDESGESDQGRISAIDERDGPR